MKMGKKNYTKIKESGLEALQLAKHTTRFITVILGE